MVPHSNGMCPLELGKPDAASVMVPIPLVVWLRPVIKHDRVGEHNAVVRTPVREALRRLESDGFRARRGAPLPAS